MDSDGTTVEMTTLPDCSICVHVEHRAEPRVAIYDGRTHTGSWAYMCAPHWQTHSNKRLGTGFGQRIVLVKPDAAAGEEALTPEDIEQIEKETFPAFMTDDVLANELCRDCDSNAVIRIEDGLARYGFCGRHGLMVISLNLGNALVEKGDRA